MKIITSQGKIKSQRQIDQYLHMRALKLKRFQVVLNEPKMRVALPFAFSKEQIEKKKLQSLYLE